jgi:hypothetical protein
MRLPAFAIATYRDACWRSSRMPIFSTSSTKLE